MKGLGFGIEGTGIRVGKHEQVRIAQNENDKSMENEKGAGVVKQSRGFCQDVEMNS